MKTWIIQKIEREKEYVPMNCKPENRQLKNVQLSILQKLSNYTLFTQLFVLHAQQSLQNRQLGKQSA